MVVGVTSQFLGEGTHRARAWEERREGQVWTTHQGLAVDHEAKRHAEQAVEATL